MVALFGCATLFCQGEGIVTMHGSSVLYDSGSRVLPIVDCGSGCIAAEAHGGVFFLNRRRQK
jgi:hypothetical protein